MLNYNKIHSSINFGRTPKLQIAKYIGIGESTFRSRLERENLTPNDVEKIAEFFNKPIAYYFDKEESDIVAEPKSDYKRTCLECIEKDKEIGILKGKLLELHEKLLEIIEEQSGKNANRQCG